LLGYDRSSMSKPRRILEVLGQSAGGVGRHVEAIVRELDGRDGLSMDVAAPSGLQVPMPKAVLPVEIPNGPIAGHLGAIRDLRKLLKGGRYHLVHAHGLRASLDAALAGRIARVPVVSTLHNLVIDEVAGGRAILYRRSERLAVALTARTLVPSIEIAERLRSAAPRSADKIEVLYAGTVPPPQVSRSAHEVRAELGLHPDQPLIVTVARLHPQKALGVMLEALAELESEAVLTIIGEGPLEETLKNAARHKGLEKRIRWLGFREDVADYIAAADVFCLSSVWEAVPLAAQEAVQLGTAVVATDVGGLSELISDGESGRLVPKNDPQALADALRATMASKDLRAGYATKARAWFEQRFSREAIIARLCEIYTQGVET
jgi:glycosyltransferase involved in cell wall biosynthesis